MRLEVDDFFVIELWLLIYFLSIFMIGWGELSFKKRFKLTLLLLIRQQKVGIETSLR